MNPEGAHLAATETSWTNQLESVDATTTILVCDPSGHATREICRFASQSTIRKVFIARLWPELQRPFSPFPDLAQQLLAKIGPLEPEIGRRYRETLATLQIGSGRSAKPERRFGTPSWLSAYVRTGEPWRLRDFFQGRNVEPRIRENLAHFILEAARCLAPQAKTLLVIEGVEALSQEAQALTRVLVTQSMGSSLQLVLLSSSADLPWAEDLLATGAILRARTDYAEHEAVRSVETLPHVPRRVFEALSAGKAAFRDNDLRELLPDLDILQLTDALVLLRESNLALSLDGEVFLADRRAENAISFSPPHAEIDLARRFLLCSEVVEDPFLKAHHSWNAGDGTAAAASFEAADLAWSASAYSCAEFHLGRALGSGTLRVAIEPALAFALLAYESGRFEDASHYFSEAIRSCTDGQRALWLTWLQGYNYVFGLRRHEDAIRILESVLKSFEAVGRVRDALWVRNTMAYSMASLGRHAEASKIEHEALETSRDLEQQDRFQLMILNLNLGRLHRAKDAARAEGYLRRALREIQGEVSSYLLLLGYLTLALLEARRGRVRSALLWFGHCETLLLDLDVSGFARRSFGLLQGSFAGQVGQLTGDWLSEGDQGRMFLHVCTGLLYARLGSARWAGWTQAWAERELRRAGCTELLPALERAFAAESQVRTVDLSSTDDMETVDLARLHEVVSAAEPADLPLEIASGLSRGQTVAWVAPRTAPWGPIDSFVLFNPAQCGLRSRVEAELQCHSAAGGVLALAAGADWFDGLSDSPEVIQTANVSGHRRRELPSLQPIQTHVRIIAREHGQLFETLLCFSKLAGIPLLGVAPFRLSGEELVRESPQAVRAFLETGFDLLVWGKEVLRKLAAPSAVTNLAVLKPTTLGRVRISADGTSDLSCSPGKRLRLAAGASAFLEEARGGRTVAELTDALHLGSIEEVCRFLKQIRSQRGLYFSL